VSRLRHCFELLREEGRQALVPYIMTGDPQADVTVPLMHAMVGVGANVIELGAPFSDPMADGPVIQAAAERSLANGTSLQDVFAAVQEFRRLDDVTPVVLMGYLNPVEVTGYELFAERAAAAGVDGVITVDMPPEEAADYIAALRGHGVDPVFLIAPTTSVQRIVSIGEAASGFVYYVSLKGVTGAASLDVDSVSRRIALIREHIGLPVGVGFGISDAAAAARVSACADAVVVGSAIVKRMAANAGLDAAHRTERIIEDVTELLASMRLAMDADNPGDSRTKTA